jgi:hypothetical protein
MLILMECCFMRAIDDEDEATSSRTKQVRTSKPRQSECQPRNIKHSMMLKQSSQE